MPAEDTADGTRNTKHMHVGKGHWIYAISEIEYISSEAGDVRFRIVVEAEATASVNLASPRVDR
jgi:hypothetical protein